MTTLLARDALKGNILDQIANLEVRLRSLEELGGGVAGGASGGASLPSAGDDYTVAVSFNDSFPNYLDGKLAGDSPLIVVELNNGGNEQLLLSIAPHLTPDAHHAPVTAGDGISLSGQQVAVDSSVVRTSRSITAGSGLTGGGDLSANRTINVGAGAGITVNADDVALTTPGGLSATSTNNAAGSHTHAIAASANPGAAESLLKTTSGGLLTLHSLTLTNDLILGRVDSDALPKATAVRDLGSTGLKWRNLHLSGSVNANAGLFAGAVDVGDDLTVGLNVLQVDVSGQRVGINRAADPQFQLDVLGNMRASGYIVGQHAIQLSEAVGIWHFDGANPDDFDGSLLGHKGQTPEQVYGPTVFRPGRFGKAIQVAGATTNILPNPILGSALSPSWSSNNSYVTLSLSTERVLFGSNSVKATISNTLASSFQVTMQCPFAGGMSPLTGSIYVYLDDLVNVTGSSVIVMVPRWEGGANAAANGTGVVVLNQLQNKSGWWRISLTATPDYGDRNYVRFYVQVFNTRRQVGDYVHMDGGQIEVGSYPTPLAYGDMPGHAWTGTPHASTSTRGGNALVYPQQPLGQSGTVMFWWKPSGNTGAYQQLWGQGGLALFYDGGSQQMRLFNSNGPVYGGYPMAITPETWYFLALVWTPQEMRLYVNPNSGTPSDTQAISGSNLDGTMILSHPDNSANGLIDELVVVNRALDADLIRAVYESNAPVFAETSTWSFQLPNNLVWADEEGLWMRRATGEAAFGMVGVDGKSWGGLTLDAGDLLIGNTAGNYVRFDASAGTVTFAGDGDGITNIDGGNIQTGTITADSLDVSQLSAITADLGTVTAGHISGATIEAGQGALLLDDSGMSLRRPTTLVEIYEEADAETKIGDIGMNGQAVRISRSQFTNENLMPNPTFEDSDIDWSVIVGSGWADLSRTSDQAYVGSHSLLAIWQVHNLDFSTGDYVASPFIPISGAAALVKFAAKVNTSYRYSSTVPEHWVCVKWYNDSDAPVGVVTFLGNRPAVISGDWRFYEIFTTKPGGATKLRLIVGNEGSLTIAAPDNGSFALYVDAITVLSSPTTDYAYLDLTPQRVATNKTLGLVATGTPTAFNNEANIYVKSNKLIIQYVDGAWPGTTRYKYLDLTGTGATWTHTTTPP